MQMDENFSYNKQIEKKYYFHRKIKNYTHICKVCIIFLCNQTVFKIHYYKIRMYLLFTKSEYYMMETIFLVNTDFLNFFAM